MQTCRRDFHPEKASTPRCYSFYLLFLIAAATTTSSCELTTFLNPINPPVPAAPETALFRREIRDRNKHCATRFNAISYYSPHCANSMNFLFPPSAPLRVKSICYGTNL
jgi:hypothetical protein